MKKLHLICNSHIDTIWQWEWAEGMSATLSTFQSAANLMEKHDYIFCHGESSIYEYTEKCAPELFKRIQQLVKENKWHVTGGWYLQPDCLMGHGESYIRQIRVGMDFFRSRFGEENLPKTAVCFDAFGHSRGLVQIVKKCGQENYIFMRPYSKYIRPQLELPSEYFYWEGYDGSRIKAFRGTEYNSPLGKAAEKISVDMERLKDYEETVSLWGVGNHGGGPSHKDLTDIENLMRQSDVQIIHSTPDTFFAENEPGAVWDQSLISCMPGCYTSMAALKQIYRELEREQFLTEKMRSAAALRGICEYPADTLREVTEDVLTVMFHDVLAGTVIKAGEDNSMRYINHGLKELERLKLEAFFGMVKGQSVAEENTYPIFVFNPKPYDGEQLVECELSIIPTDYFDTEYSKLRIYDEDGQTVPCQTIKEASNISIDWRKKVIFKAKLKPLDITRFTARTVVEPKPLYPYGQDITFDNGIKKLRISKETGLIESYMVNGREYAQGDMFQLVSYDDTADPWAMSEEELRSGIGKNPVPFTLLGDGDGVFQGLHSLEITEDGPIYLAAEAFFACGLTRARIGYKIYKEGSTVDVDVDLFPAEANKCVKLHIPVQAESYIGQQVFGTEALYMDGRECVAHDFVAMKNGEDYLQVLTPDSFGSSYKDGTARLTLLRNVTYLAHPVPDRPLTRDNIFLPKCDQGQRSYRLRLQPAKENALQKNADLFAEKPFAMNIFPTVDRKSGRAYEIFHTNPDIALVTLFRATETDGYILRLQNNTSQEAKTVLHCGSAVQELHFGKYEVKTVALRGERLEEMDMFLI